jgi:hypothetical protein
LYVLLVAIEVILSLSHPFDLSLKESLHWADLLSVKRANRSRAGIAVVIATAIALGGCMSANNNPVSNGNRLTAEAKLTEINANMTVAMTSNPGSLPQLTQEYINAVQDSESLLGADEAKQKLAATAAQLATACISCAQSLNTAAAQIGQ